MAASAARALVLSRFTDLSLNPLLPNSPPSSLFSRHLLPSRKRRLASSSFLVSCLISGVDGGGVSDDFVSTRKSGFDRGFSVIANMLKRIEPLDTSVISKGISDPAKDSMKQTISTMLGLLPSDQFSVTVRVSKLPLRRLLVSSIITGYTLWNAEYRISLTRNLEISTNNSKNTSNCQDRRELSEEDKESEEDRDTVMRIEDLESRGAQVFGALSPEALNYIQRLRSELSDAEEELTAQKQENLQIENGRGNRNNLLEYLRSLHPDMVNELSRPSSLEVEEIIQQLVQNVLSRFFKEERTENHPDGDDEFSDSTGASRDYLAKLLFWCMLLGHHLRGLENRLHLSCVVGLL
ncbi:hypothetical protein F2P56_021325 [Juglans regia]|uniref:Seed maturation-like protein n=2 Tax=Juglans regia TaxID=51240 RepID=A0A833X2D0_JUGRE|nr:uncharacterized protein LOC109008943 [Juglans regia]KAF5457209.1 hypothetical protein F2P56_021325 [Juglans regia]